MPPKFKSCEGGGKAVAPSKLKIKQQQQQQHEHEQQLDSDDPDEYRRKRDRNNIAVKKSRERSRAKAKETLEKVDKLKQENADLEYKVQLLSKELSVLKDLFLTHAGAVQEPQCNTCSIKAETVQEDHKYSVQAQVQSG